MAENDNNASQKAVNVGKKALKITGKILKSKTAIILIIVFGVLILLESSKYVIFKDDTADDGASYMNWQREDQGNVTYE